MTQGVRRVYEFGEFRLDTAERLLLRHGEPLPLTPKVFDTLLKLVEEHGRLIEKDEFMERLWPGTYVGEDTLAHNISVIRKVLGDAANGQKYIATVPKRGYRFVAEVSETGESVDSTSGTHGTAQRVEPARSLHLARALAALGVIVLLAGYGAWRRFRERIQPSANARIMLAVLPFQNLSGDPSQEYVSDGMTEEMITQLGRMKPDRLGVIARTSAMTYKGVQKNTAQIGRELGVDYILEGSVRRAGDRLRISAQLINVKDQTHLWAQNYDGSLGDLLALQGEVAGAVTSEIAIKLGPQPPTAFAKARSVNRDAYEAYLRGRYLWNKRTQEGFQRAIAYFHQAIAEEPEYAAAYAGLADVYLLQGGLPPAETIPKAKAAAQKALGIDDTLAEPHASLGLVAMNYNWDWAEAERQYKRALELNSNYATAHHWYGEYLVAMGRFDEAVIEIKHARELDPLSLIISSDLGKILCLARRSDQAIEQLRKTVEMDPSFVPAHFWLALTYAQKGMFREAIAELQSVSQLDDTKTALSALGMVYGLAGQREKAQQVLAELMQLVGQRYIDPDCMVLVYLGLGEKEQTFTWFEKEYVVHSTGLTSLRVNPFYDSLRSDPRFTDLMRRVGLRQYAAGLAHSGQLFVDHGFRARQHG